MVVRCVCICLGRNADTVMRCQLCTMHAHLGTWYLSRLYSVKVLMEFELCSVVISKGVVCQGCCSRLRMLFFGLREDDWCSSTLDLGICSVTFPTPVECEKCLVVCSCVVCVTRVPLHYCWECCAVFYTCSVTNAKNSVDCSRTWCVCPG